jgi:hypothetical protein
LLAGKLNDEPAATRDCIGAKSFHWNRDAVAVVFYVVVVVVVVVVAAAAAAIRLKQLQQ